MWTPTLSVARLTVDVVVWTITSDDRVQCLRAIVALVAIPMPVPTLRNHQFSGKNHATATRTTRTRFRLNLGRM